MVLDLVRNFLKANADSKLKKGMDDAKKNITEGQDKMINSGENINNSLNGLADANSKVTDFANELSQIQSTLSSQLANIASMTGDLSGLNAQLANQTSQLNQAQSRLDEAMARTDLSLSQKRAEIRSANYDLMQANLAVNDTNFNLANVTDSLNSAGSQYNQSLSQASATRDNLSNSYGQAQTFQNALNASVNQYNQGAQQYSQGFTGLKDSVGNYQNTMSNQIAPLVEGSAGLQGASGVMNAVADGRYAGATGNALLSGVDAYARNGGPFELSMARALIGAGINSASQAVDGSFASGDWSNAGLNFAKDFGQATLRTNDMMRVGQGIDLAYTIANNTSNPNRLYDASQVLVQQVGTTFQIGTTITQTASTLIPGAQAVSPAIGMIGPTLGTGAQGLASTVVETANKLYTQGLSAQTGNYPSLGIGRGLVSRDAGGPTSAVSTLILGGGVSIASTAKQAVVGSLTGKSFANQASATINAIANTGLPSAGITTSLRVGSVDLRPPSATPVGGTTVAF
jgi:predicted  nucleic acid-binding Zn-ribbon protein